ncbi:hypothetical protein [Vibrio sp. J2-4]
MDHLNSQSCPYNRQLYQYYQSEQTFQCSYCKIEKLFYRNL